MNDTNRLALHTVAQAKERQAEEAEHEGRLVVAKAEGEPGENRHFPETIRHRIDEGRRFHFLPTPYK